MKRILALVLSMAMLLSCLAQPVTALAAGAELKHGKDLTSTGEIMPGHEAMHFIVRHWHSSDQIALDDIGNQLENLQSSGSYYFVVLEGYIVPHDDQYDFYLVDQKNNTTLEYLPEGYESPYVKGIDRTLGKIYLKGNPVKPMEHFIERFSGYSVSAGHGAVEETGDGVKEAKQLTITYDKYIHLVKAHAFYIGEDLDQVGTDDNAVFGVKGISKTAEQDTAHVYVLKENDAAEIVKDDAGELVLSKDELPAGKENAEWTKVYNTSAGLHTDKTAHITDVMNDKRTFNLDLEAWYIDGAVPVVGMVLDASGSMAFAAEDPTAINFSEVQATLSAFRESDDPAEVSLAYSFDGMDQVLAGEAKRVENGAVRDMLPKRGNLKGYYTFINGGFKNTGNTDHEKSKRYWLRNSVDGSFANVLDKSLDKQGSGAYSFGISDADTEFDWPDHAVKMYSGDGKNGYFGITNASSTTGVLVNDLGANYKGDFTVSFTVWKNDSDSRPTDPAEIMYVGALNGDFGQKNYVSVYRNSGSSSYRLRADNGAGTSPVVNVNSLFTGTSKNVVTMVFETDKRKSATAEGTPYIVTTYVYQIEGDSKITLLDNGPYCGEATLADCNIILNPFTNGAYRDAGGAEIEIDEIFVYDTALHDGEVAALSDLVAKHLTDNGGNGTETVDIDEKNSQVAWKEIFLSDRQLAMLMDPRMTDNSRLSASDYSYFVYDSRSSAQEYAPLGYWDGTDGNGKPAISAKNAIAKNYDEINDKALVLGKFNNVADTGKGWYFIGHKGSSGVWNDDYANENVGTAKRLYGLDSVLQSSSDYLIIQYKDEIELPNNYKNKNPGIAAGGTHAVYQPYPFDTASKDSTAYDTEMKFYLDGNGYLRCFYTPGNNEYRASYVYQLADSEYIKVESLQRALGAFVTELRQISRYSKVAATRFSTNDIKPNQLGELVLLDWTNAAAKSAGMLSLAYGEGDKKGRTTGSETGDNGVEQYNYGMTGSTSTQQGLQAFINSLADKVSVGATGMTELDKYLIIFTDGKDTDIVLDTDTITTTKTPSNFGTDYSDSNQYQNKYTTTLRDWLYKGGTYTEYTDATKVTPKSDKNNVPVDLHEAINLAMQLKQKGYTIFTVMLSGGPVIKGNEDYEQAHIFLRELAGNMETDGITETTNTTDLKTLYSSMNLEEKEKYFFSIEKAIEELKAAGQYDASMKNEDVLTTIFSRQILYEMTNTISGYTVQDYIDPRFDLVDYSDSDNPVVWHLNKGGKVVVGDNGETFTVTGSSERKIQLNKIDCDDKADAPYLRYDSENDMYCLVWVNQDIPGAAIGTDNLSVWNARVTVRAKDDFIGGNAVMTNGHAAGMNFVYHPDDKKPSSGTEKDHVPYEEHPSKGFPRTVVNVEPTEAVLIRDRIIYMGEALTKVEAAEQLVRDTEKAAATDPDRLVRYYWEYLIRYAKNTGEPLTDLMTRLITNRELELDYAYLPNSDGGSNQPGTKRHQEDVVGKLVYELVELEPEDRADLDGYIQKNAHIANDLLDRLADYPADGVTRDTLPRLLKLKVTFRPKDDVRGDRKADNDKLVTETYEGNPVYQWDVDYKPADDEEMTVGEVQKKHVLIRGFYITQIVSGEVRLQVEVANNKALAGQSFTYVANLVREDPDGKPSVVGQLKLENVTINGQNTLYNATFTPAMGYMGYDGSVSSQYGLPIGAYTLQPVASLCAAPEGYVFRDATLVIAPDQYVGLFTKGTRYDVAEQYLASGDAALRAFILGDKAAARLYTDYRFGLFRVPLTNTDEGVLSVSKTVTGTAGDKQKAFAFMIILSDTGVNGAFGDMIFSNGVANFTLKHGETKTATGLPTGVRYTVSETGAAQDGYAVSATGQSGVISQDGASKAIFINAKDAPEVPQTGDESNLILWVVLLVLSALGIGLYFVKGRGKKN